MFFVFTFDPHGLAVYALFISAIESTCCLFSPLHSLDFITVTRVHYVISAHYKGLH
jgi:hypothetical protein